MGNKFFLLIIITTVIFGSCKSSKYVPENEFLLDKVLIKSKDKEIKSADLRHYLKQNSNLKILGVFKLHLGIYNLSGRNEENGFNNWLKRIGEEPVILDSLANEQSCKELTKYLQNKGFLNAKVSDTILYSKGKKATVVYNVNPGKPYTIADHQVQVEDPVLEILVNADSANTLIEPGKAFDVELLDEERERISTLLRNEGYYGFSKEYIHFSVDSTGLDHEIVDTLVIRNPKIINELGEKAEALHTRYTIRNTYFITDYDPKEALKLQETYYQTFDTMIVEGHHFLFHEKPNVKPIVFILNNLIKPGDPYNLRYAERTHTLLNSIPIVRYVNIRFIEVQNAIEPLLDCIIQITPAKKHYPSLDVEVTHQNGSFGAALNTMYQHRNLFKGGEQLSLKLSLAREYQKELNGDKTKPADEFGFETSLLYPRFLFPLLSRQFKESFRSSTTFTGSYNYQKRPDYNRQISNLSMNYKWKGRSNWDHSLDIIDFNFVDIQDMSTNFADYIKDIFLQYSYEDHVIHNVNYTLMYNNQNQRSFRDTRYFRFSIESAGNALYAANYLSKASNANGAYEFAGINFSQYLKFDAETTYNQYFNEKNTIAYHASIGAAYPYGNQDVMPFEKRYFGGGANGIRGWQVRSLGPGTYKNDVLNYMNQSGDIKLQLNAEYRFKLFWVLEGALFLDAGNIWTIREYDEQQEGYFKFDTFYKQIALAYGIGTRFDFSFFVFRVDWGLKGLDPTRSKWVTKPLLNENYTLHLAIGYPF